VPDVSGVDAADSSGFLLRTVRALAFPVARLCVGWAAGGGFRGEKAILVLLGEESGMAKRRSERDRGMGSARRRDPML
jgi:hypothetical protein